MSADTPKKPTVKARLPRGLGDRGPADLAAERAMTEKIREVYERYGFEAVETPFIEYTEALGKFLPDTDRPNAGVFSFQDDDEQWMSLRYDLTAPLARYVAENFDALPKPYRSYRAGWVFRNEKPGPGRFRQFMQFDADTVGSSSPAADAEMCMMAADTLEALGVPRGQYVIRFNHRGLLDGLMRVIGLEVPDVDGTGLRTLRAMDKFDRLGEAGVRLLLGKGRRDESGDFTKGADMNDAAIDVVIDFLKMYTFHNPSTALVKRPDPKLETTGGILFKMTPALQRVWPSLQANPEFLEALNDINKIRVLVEAAGYGQDRIKFDPSVVRGLEYYTGPVFEAELTFEVPGEDGKPIRFGSVGGGGRYDGLVGRFRGESVPATGFSIGVSRLFAALKAVKSSIVTRAARPGPVVVLVLPDKKTADQTEAAYASLLSCQLARYQTLVQALRNSEDSNGIGIRAEMYLGNSGMNAQLKYADKRGAICAVIQGSNERENGEVLIRDLVLGAQLGGAAKERADYLELRQKAQFAVSVDGMVAAVREVRARYVPSPAERVEP